MKMENYVYAPAAGTVKEILVGPSDGVDAGEPLVSFDVDSAKGSDKTAAKNANNTAAKEE